MAGDGNDGSAAMALATETFCARHPRQKSNTCDQRQEGSSHLILGTQGDLLWEAEGGWAGKGGGGGGGGQTDRVGDKLLFMPVEEVRLAAAKDPERRELMRWGNRRSTRARSQTESFGQDQRGKADGVGSLQTREGSMQDRQNIQ